MITVKLRLLLSTLLLVSLWPVSSNAMPIYACAEKHKGTLRLVDAPGQCHRKEYEFMWDDGSGIQAQLNALQGRVTLLESVIGVLNAAPTVSAGPNQSILRSSPPAVLNGSVSDDGVLMPVTIAWTQVSGPGVAVFDTPSGEDTHVTFDAIGEYVLRLTAFDGLVSVADETIVRVFPDNNPPSVTAGPDQILTGTVTGGEATSSETLSCTTTVSGTATDDGVPAPLAVLWSSEPFGDDDPRGLPGTTGFGDARAFSTTVTVSLTRFFGLSSQLPAQFSATLILSVNDGFYARSDTVTITCLKP